MIKEYSLKKDGETKLSKYFKVKEFACHDGSDLIKIDTELIDGITEIREHFNLPMTLTSAYRTPSHNNSVDGATSSYHTKGQAVDFKIKGIHPIEIAYYLPNTKFKRYGLYIYSNSASQGFIHVDTGDGEYLWISPREDLNYKKLSKVMPDLEYGDEGYTVGIIQRKLGVIVDGIFGSKTLKALKSAYGVEKVTEDIWKKMFFRK